MTSAFASPLWLIAGAAMLAAAIASDVKTQRIPNAVVAGGLVAALALSALPGGIGAPNALAGMGAGFLVLLPAYLLRVMGAGDVKLLAAVGAFIGFPGVLGAALAALLAGGVLALAWAVWHRRLRAVLANLRDGFLVLMADAAARRRPAAGAVRTSPARIPYAVAIAAGAVMQVLLAGGFAWRGGI